MILKRADFGPTIEREDTSSMSMTIMQVSVNMVFMLVIIMYHGTCPGYFTGRQTLGMLVY